MNKPRTYFPSWPLVALVLSASGLWVSLAAHMQIERDMRRAACHDERCVEAFATSSRPDVFAWWGETREWRTKHAPWLVGQHEQMLLLQQRSLLSMLSELDRAKAQYFDQQPASSK